jgi:DNA replication and repair protein RecF
VHLVRLYAEAFRNLREVRLEPHRRLTAFVGDNGEGKTNLLEAVHLAAALRPLRQTERAKDLVRFDSERGVVRADFDLDGPLDVEVQVEPKGRRALIAGKAVRDVAEVAARIGVVAFTPEDLSIVRAGPDYRRRALDQFAYGLAPHFALLARRYEQALERRNRLLKQPRPDVDQLSSYSAPLVEAGVELARARAQAAARWAPAFAEDATRITDAAVETSLAYACTFADEEALLHGSPAALEEGYREKLASQRDAERQRRTTLAGPHLDDVALHLGDKRARRLASQGEARAIVLALKLSAVRLYTEARGTAPLLLLDDVAGELDPHKARCLFETVDSVGAQTFVTATHTGVLPALGEARVVRVAGGRVVG